MSQTVETSRTALEIYQPIIVGLGAVVLGLFVNGLLELWKAKIRLNEEKKAIRNALVLSLTVLDKTMKSALNSIPQTFEGGQCYRPNVQVSSFLSNLDPIKLGILSSEEVDSFSVVSGLLGAFVSGAEIGTNRNRFGEIIILQIDDKQDLKVVRGLLKSGQGATEECLRVIRNNR